MGGKTVEKIQGKQSIKQRESRRKFEGNRVENREKIGRKQRENI